jgi:PHD/YefM family antitoxin component YafN of YafNO toxin-antitoxin module
MERALIHGKHETEWVTISKDEYDSMISTIEVLSDKDLMDHIKNGKKKDVKSRNFEEIAKELNI